MVYGIYISSCAFYPVKHEVTVPHEMDDAVSVLFHLGMGTQFQAAGGVGWDSAFGEMITSNKSMLFTHPFQCVFHVKAFAIGNLPA